MCLLTAALGLSAVFGFIKSNRATGNIVNNATPAITTLREIRYQLSTIRRVDGFLLMCDNSQCTQKYVEKRKVAIAAFKAGMEAYSPMATAPAERELYEMALKNANAYLVLSDQMSALDAAGKIQDAQHLLVADEASKTYNDALNEVQEDVELKQQDGAKAGVQSIQLGHTLLLGISAMVAIKEKAVDGLASHRRQPQDRKQMRTLFMEEGK